MFDKYPKIYEQIFRDKGFINMLVKQLPEDTKEKDVLDLSTIVTMAKNPAVQFCQPVANQAFANIESIQQRKQDIEGKEIS